MTWISSDALRPLPHLPPPEGLEGSALVPVLKDMDAVKARYAISENYREGFEGRMIRRRREIFFYTVARNISTTAARSG